MSTVKSPRDRERPEGTGDFQLSLLIRKKPATENVSSNRKRLLRETQTEARAQPRRAGAALGSSRCCDYKDCLECDHPRETVDSVAASGHGFASQGSSRSQSRLWGSGPSFVRKQQRMGSAWARRSPPPHVYAKNLEDFLLGDPKWW